MWAPRRLDKGISLFSKFEGHIDMASRLIQAICPNSRPDWCIPQDKILYLIPVCLASWVDWSTQKLPGANEVSFVRGFSVDKPDILSSNNQYVGPSFSYKSEESRYAQSSKCQWPTSPLIKDAVLHFFKGSFDFLVPDSWHWSAPWIVFLDCSLTYTDFQASHAITLRSADSLFQKINASYGSENMLYPTTNLMNSIAWTQI